MSEKQDTRIFSLANMVTASRVLFLPGFIYAFLSGTTTGYIVALAFAVYFEATDWFDGAIARKLNQVSTVGKLLDPLCDTLSRFTIFLTFMAAGIVPLWMILILFFRDMIVAYIRVAAATMNFVMSARNTGKIKAAVQAGGIFGITVVHAASKLWFKSASPDDVAWWVTRLSWWLMFPVIIYTTYSLCDYIYGLVTIGKTNGDEGKE